MAKANSSNNRKQTAKSNKSKKSSRGINKGTMQCPSCGSRNVWGKGTVNTKAYGERKRAYCKNCATTFYP